MENNTWRLIDFAKVDTLLEGFNNLTGFVTAIIDLDGNILSKSGWRQMCTEFHRINPETSKKCIISDTELANKMGEGQKYHFYKCLNGLVDVAMPIVIKGEHIANLFSGQFFFEEPDITFFKKQAKQYGFDEEKYLTALKRVPVVSQEKVETAMEFLLNMTQVISDMTFQKLEQMELNKSIRESEEKFKSVFESANAAKSITLPTGEINVNQAFCEMLGYNSEELKQKKWQDITPSEEIEFVQKELEPLLTGKKTATRFNKRYIHKNGSIVWADVSVSLHFDVQKKPLYFITTIINITDRKRAEEESQMSVTNFRNLADSIQDGIVIAPADGRHIYANRRVSELLGYSPEEMLKTTQKDLADPAAYPMLKQRLIDRIEGRPVPGLYETILRRKDGTSFTAEVSGTPILWQGQKCDLVLFRDITERKQTEINLQNSEQKYRNLVENSLVGVLRSKVNGEIIYVNDAIVRMLEFDSREELISAGAYMRYKYPSQRDEFIRILKKDGQVSGFEANILTQKGNERILLYSLILNGETIDGTLIDITERKRIEKEIEDSQQFLKSITSEVQEVIFALDAQGVFTFSEGKGLEKLGLKPGQVVGMSVFDVYKDFPEVIVGLREALNGKMVKTESLLVGSMSFTTTYQPIFDENGKLASVVGLAVDVTDAKNAEKALNEHAIRIQALLDLNQMTQAPFDEILDFVLDTSQKMTGSEFSFVGMVDPEETELTIHRWSQGVMEQCNINTGTLRFSVAETGLLCECIRTRQPVIVNDYNTNSHPSKKGIPMGHVPISRMMAVPSIEKGHVVSVISLANKFEDYTIDDALGITSLLNKMVEIKKWKEADEALHQSKRELATLMNNLPGMVYSCLNDHNWTMQFVSEGVFSLTGYLPDDLIGNKIITFEEIILAEDRDLVWTTIQASLEKKVSYDLEYRILGKTGIIKHVWERGQGIFNDNGDLLNLEGFITDITARKLAEDALQEANDKLESRVLERTVELAKSKKLLDETSRMARIGGWELNLADNQQTWTEMVYQIHEVDLDFNPTLNSGISFYAPEALPVISEAVQLAMTEGKPWDLQLPFITAKQNRLWVRAIGRAIWKDDKIVRLGGIFQDITEQKNAEDELTKYREHLEELVKDRTEKLETQYALLNSLINSPGDILIFSLDTNYCYTAFNEKHSQEMKKIWNTDIKIGTNILEYMHIPEIRVLAKSSIDRVLNGEAFSEVQHQPNADIYYELNWNPILKEKDIVGVTVFVHNISERKRSENEIMVKNEELENLNATKDKFFSIIAHDLRSPFSSFLGLTQIMAEDLPNLTMVQIQDFAVKMSKSATHLYRLLENLLQWSRMQQGTILFNPETIELDLVVDESIEMIQEQAKSKGIEIGENIPNGLTVFADTNLLQMVIRNLVSNAVKFTSKGGKVNIFARSSDEKSVEISIQDTGIGMSKTMIDNLFRIDIQTNRKGTEGEPSTGLGLILCKEFVEKHGGKIWVESDEFRGSKFYFTLLNNTQPTSENNNSQSSHSAKNSDVRKLKILIAEDDEVSEMLLMSFIKSFGKKILQARTGVEAVEVIRTNPDIDLILMDIRMPDLNGYEAVKQIREFNKEVVIIAQTAFGLTGDREKAIAAGCNEYIAKPIKKSFLQALIINFFGK